MDGLASIGRAFATPQFIIATLLGILMMAVGFYTVSIPDQPTPPGTKPVPPQSKGARTMGGIVLIVIGAFIPFAAWWRRKLIRSNPTLATVVGILDIESMIKMAIR